MVTNDAALAARLKRLRNGGQTERYHHVEFGVNSRLDDMQAAILRARLPLTSAWTARRRELAARYRRALTGAPGITVPLECDPGHVYHLFPVLIGASYVAPSFSSATNGPHVAPSFSSANALRDAFQQHLAAHGIGTLVHYPIALHRQQAFAQVPSAPCPTAERVADQVCSLPLHPHLGDSDFDAIVAAIHGWDNH